MRRLWWALLVLGLGCGPGARPIGAPPPPPRITPGELDATALLNEPAARAVKAGASAVSVVAAGAAVEGERSGAFVEVAPDACLLAYARGSATVEDVDVVAISDEGNALAVDERPDPHPTLILCPPHPPRVFVTFHVVAGEGLVALGAHAVPREKAAEVARVLGARGPVLDAAARRAEAWPGLDDRVRAHRVAIGGKWEDVRKVAVPLDARAPSVAPLPIEPDHCLDVLVVPDEDVASLDVEARDSEGRVLARAREGGRDRTLTLCSPFAVSGTLVIRPHMGSGLAAVVLGRARSDVTKELSGPVDVVWTASTMSLEQARASRAPALTKAGYAAPTANVTGNATLGRRSMLALDVPTPCARLDVIGGAPLALVEVRAWDDGAALAGSAEGAQGAVLFACGRKHITVEVEAKGRPGPFAIEVRKEPWESPTFVAAPLAASRMLGRLADAPPWTLRGALGSARSLSVDPAHRATWDETVPSGQCAIVAVGVEGEGTGVDLRVIDPPTGEELDRSHGDASALVTACAQGTPRRVRLELAAGAGKLSAVAGTRLR